jgi:hypothetical protein
LQRSQSGQTEMRATSSWIALTSDDDSPSKRSGQFANAIDPLGLRRTPGLD